MRHRSLSHIVLALMAGVSALATPLTELAHGMAHDHRAAEGAHEPGRAAHDHDGGPGSDSWQAPDHSPDHAALHGSGCALRSSACVLGVLAVPPSVLETTIAQRVIIAHAQANAPPPPCLARSDLPRAPPVG